MRSLIIILLTLMYSSWAWAQFPGGASSITLETDQAVCDPERGIVEAQLNSYGALGSAIQNSSRYHYDPLEQDGSIDDQGFVSTIFEWKAFTRKNRKEVLVSELSL